MNAPLLRGKCPGLSAPMQTGDGLLVRLRPIGTIPLTAFAKLCAAAREHGNGIMEITARGNIQVRGLDAASAPLFAAAIGALGIAADDGVPVHTNPLAGLDPDEILDAGKLAADLRRALARTDLAARLAPKISVMIDGGGALSLDALSADVRLRAEFLNGDAALRISVGGDQANVSYVGVVATANGTEAAIRLLDVMARHGRVARASDILDAEGIEPFCGELTDLLLTSARLNSRLRGNERESAIGMHALRDGLFAYGIGLAFGHANASSLEHLAEAAAAAGAIGLRTAPDRTLIAVGLAEAALSAFIAEAGRLGFIVCADDPRRYVFACAGAPVCASGHIAARAMAPRIAVDSAEFLGRSFTIHVSGCTKGCAHPLPAALTVVGIPEGCALIEKGAARDAPFATVAADQVPAAVASAVREGSHV